MRHLKHVGRIVSTNTNLLVAFRTLPGDANSALVVIASRLTSSYHDELMSLVESDAGQASNEFGELLFMRSFSDGRPMLRALRADGILETVPTSNILMIPNSSDTILLSNLNSLIAEQRNCTVDELCLLVSGAPSKLTDIPEIESKDLGEPTIPVNQHILSDKDLADNLRKQADLLLVEVESLNNRANELDPIISTVETKIPESSVQSIVETVITEPKVLPKSFPAVNKRVGVKNAKTATAVKK
jgi:hypothetical protein